MEGYLQNDGDQPFSHSVLSRPFQHVLDEDLLSGPGFQGADELITEEQAVAEAAAHLSDMDMEGIPQWLAASFPTRPDPSPIRLTGDYSHNMEPGIWDPNDSNFGGGGGRSGGQTKSEFQVWIDISHVRKALRILTVVSAGLSVFSILVLAAGIIRDFYNDFSYSSNISIIIVLAFGLFFSWELTPVRSQTRMKGLLVYFVMSVGMGGYILVYGLMSVIRTPSRFSGYCKERSFCHDTSMIKVIATIVSAIVLLILILIWFFYLDRIARCVIALGVMDDNGNDLNQPFRFLNEKCVIRFFYTFKKVRKELERITGMHFQRTIISVVCCDFICLTRPSDQTPGATDRRVIVARIILCLSVCYLALSIALLFLGLYLAWKLSVRCCMSSSKREKRRAAIALGGSNNERGYASGVSSNAKKSLLSSDEGSLHLTDADDANRASLNLGAYYYRHSNDYYRVTTYVWYLFAVMAILVSVGWYFAWALVCPWRGHKLHNQWGGFMLLQCRIWNVLPQGLAGIFVDTERNEASINPVFQL